MIFMTDANGNLVNIANDNQGNSGLQMDLLWENPNPTSAFAAQTLTIQGLSNYKFCIVFCELETQYPNYIQANIIVPGVESNMICITATITRRQGKINGNSFIFSDGSNKDTPDNTACIPKYIYGIK